METDVVIYEPVSDRVAFVAELAAALGALVAASPTAIALILANYLAVMDALLMASDRYPS